MRRLYLIASGIARIRRSSWVSSASRSSSQASRRLLTIGLLRSSTSSVELEKRTRSEDFDTVPAFTRIVLQVPSHEAFGVAAEGDLQEGLVIGIGQSVRKGPSCHRNTLSLDLFHQGRNALGVEAELLARQDLRVLGQDPPVGFLQNAQGEDVVAGIRTPGPLAEAGRSPGNEEPSLETQMPAIYRQLTEILARLERHYRDVQDVEFTIEHGKLWILQTRSGKRTGAAAVRIALDLLDEGIVENEAEVLARVDPELHITQLLHVSIDPAIDRPPALVTGLAASPGAAAGEVVFTATGGLTSHAAVVARSMGVPCVAGAGAIEIAADQRSFRVGDQRVEAGDRITVDGTAGAAYLGRLAMVTPTIGGRFARFMEIADRHRRLGVRANADTPEEARRAREQGAEGIGLCRTEHMFFATDERLGAMPVSGSTTSAVRPFAFRERGWRRPGPPWCRLPADRSRRPRRSPSKKPPRGLRTCAGSLHPSSASWPSSP
ncbi:MAG: PEP-utilizing enzyme [Thermoanaerobaculia bacterium]